MNTYYFAHPFDSRHRLREWELRVEKELGIELINPFYDVEGRTDVELVDAGRAERYERIDAEELVKRDLCVLTECNGVIAVVDGSLSFGTIMELVYARIYGKCSYLIVTNGHHGHPWLVYHADFVFRSFEEFEEFWKSGRK